MMNLFYFAHFPVALKIFHSLFLEFSNLKLANVNMKKVLKMALSAQISRKPTTN